MIHVKATVQDIAGMLNEIKNLAKHKNSPVPLYRLSEKALFIYNEIANQNNLQSRHKLPVLNAKTHFAMGNKLRVVYEYHLHLNAHRHRSDGVRYDKMVLKQLNDHLLYVVNTKHQFMPRVANDRDIIKAIEHDTEIITNRAKPLPNAKPNRLKQYLRRII